MYSRMYPCKYANLNKKKKNKNNQEKGCKGMTFDGSYRCIKLYVVNGYCEVSVKKKLCVLLCVKTGEVGIGATLCVRHWVSVWGACCDIIVANGKRKCISVVL
jgi:hypothetical protein